MAGEFSEPLLDPPADADIEEPLCSSDDEAVVVDTGTIQVYLYRWLILALLAMSNMTSAMLWITFSPIASLTEAYYHVDATQVNALSLVYILGYFPITLASSWFYHKWGIRRGMTVACGLNCVSGFVRFQSATSNAGQHKYVILLVGQSLGALAQPFFTNLPAKIGSLWFAADQRDLAVVIGSLSNAIGIAVGSILPALYTFQTETGTEVVRMRDLLLLEFVWTLVNFKLVAVLFRERPPTPPSISESTRSTSREKNVMQELKDLLTNRNFNILLVSFGVLGLAVFNCLVTVMEQLIAPAGYTSDDASLFLGLLIGCGILSAIGVGFLLNRIHAYNECLKVGFVCAAVSFVAMLLALRPNNRAVLAMCFALMGASMLPLLPIAIECACECTYPTSEDLSTGVLQSGSQFSATLYILGISALLNRQPTYTTYVLEPAYIVFLVSAIFFVFGISFYRGKYLRLEAERIHARQENGNNERLIE